MLGLGHSPLRCQHVCDIVLFYLVALPIRCTLCRPFNSSPLSSLAEWLCTRYFHIAASPDMAVIVDIGLSRTLEPNRSPTLAAHNFIEVSHIPGWGPITQLPDVIDLV